MLPSAFLERMKGLLGDGYDSFLCAMTEEGEVRGLRHNPYKLSAADFRRLLPDLVPVPYTPDGFYHAEEKIGHSPLHHAGVFYSQDPGAMSTVNCLRAERGWRVLDMCAAPGGKSAQLAAAIGEGGTLVSCEYVPARCKQLVGNIERLGIPNALVLRADGAALSDLFPAYFDLVLLDAPCSGEGMFRKSAEAREMWSEENVRRSAARQAELLEAAAHAVREGGYLLYSTCTFSLEENEGQIAAFLEKHADFRLCPISERVSQHTAPGIQPHGCPHDLTLTRRFYPHIAPGEGQFMALMKRAGDDSPAAAPTYHDATSPLGKSEERVAASFFEANLTDGAALTARLRLYNGRLILPPPVPVPARDVFAAGVAVGEIEKGILFPHHQLFTTHGCRFKRKIRLTAGEARTAAYLHGDVIEAAGIDNGYAAVLIDGAPTGGAKVVNGVAKNLYPRGLRRMK